MKLFWCNFKVILLAINIYIYIYYLSRKNIWVSDVNFKLNKSSYGTLKEHKNPLCSKNISEILKSGPLKNFPVKLINIYG